MKKHIFLITSIIGLSLCVGCGQKNIDEQTTTEDIVTTTEEITTEEIVDTRPGINTSIIKRIDWSNTNKISFPYSYKIGSYTYPLDWNTIKNNSKLFVTDTRNVYETNSEWHLVPISTYYNSKTYCNGNGDFLCEYVGDGDTIKDGVDLIGIVEDETIKKPKDYVPINKQFYKVLELYDDFRLDSKSKYTIEGDVYYKIVDTELLKNGIYSNCGSDETKINSTVEAINDYIVNYLGKPSNIFSTIAYDEIDTTYEQKFILEWIYSDNSRVVLKLKEVNTNYDKKRDNDAGIEFFVEGLYYYPNGEKLLAQQSQIILATPEYKYNIINDIK